MPLTVKISFSLNGTQVDALVGIGQSALEMLRSTFDLAGTKLACGEGECGACTINVDGETRNSCLTPAVDLDGRKVRTAEGLWTGEGMDAIQKAFVEKGAVQCGYCTPGMLMQSRMLLDKNPDISDEEIRRGLEGNVCRCTGYTKIVEAVASVRDTEKGARHG